MTAKEVIEALQKFDQNTNVLLFSITRGNEIVPAKEIKEYEDGILITADKI
jgi:hypothetical protein